jgi:hypothetical protein
MGSGTDWLLLAGGISLAASTPLIACAILRDNPQWSAPPYNTRLIRVSMVEFVTLAECMVLSGPVLTTLMRFPWPPPFAPLHQFFLSRLGASLLVWALLLYIALFALFYFLLLLRGPS